MRDNVKRKQKRCLLGACALLFILMVYFLWEFNRDMEGAEQKRNRDTLESLAEQAAFVAENRLTSTINILETAAMLLEPSRDMRDLKTLEYMKNLAKDGEMDRIGLVDTSGEIFTTNGMEGNVSERDFFRVSMEGQVYVSTIYVSRQSKEQSIVISVPIENEEKQVCGVLYGVILVRNFNLYAQSRLDSDVERRVYVIDKNGNYIVRANDKTGEPDLTNNFFERLQGTKIKSEELVRKIQEKKSAFYALEKEGEVRNLFFAPMSVNDWCVVTVLTGEDVDININSFRRIVLVLVVKILSAIVALIGIGYYINHKEKIVIEKLNNELMIKDKIFQLAVTEAGGFVFTYDLVEHELKFLNYSDVQRNYFPRIINNFPENMPSFILPDSASHKMILEILDELGHGEENVEGDISFDIDKEILHYHLNLTKLTEKDSEGRFVIGTMINVTEERKNEVFLQSQVGRDPLTMLYNRLAAIEAVDRTLMSPDAGTCAFVILDLDNFKNINDTFGHLMGDQVLVDVAEILQKNVRSRDIVCRLGGDEFVVFLVNIPLHVVEKAIERLVRKLNKTYEKGGVLQRSSASAGVAVVPKDGTNFKELYEKADLALYRTKKQGKNGFVLYDEEEDGKTNL